MLLGTARDPKYPHLRDRTYILNRYGYLLMDSV